MCASVCMVALYSGTLRGSMSSPPPLGTAADARSPHDEQIRRELMERFAVLAEVCSRFSRDIYLRSGGPIELDNEETIRRNASIARLFFFNDPATTEIYTLSLHDAL